jgi:hypothetical protein
MQKRTLRLNRDCLLSISLGCVFIVLKMLTLPNQLTSLYCRKYVRDFLVTLFQDFFSFSCVNNEKILLWGIYLLMDVRSIFTLQDSVTDFNYLNFW